MINRRIIIVLLVIFVFVVALTLYLLNNHNKYIDNIEELKMYNSYDKKKYPKKNIIVSNKTLASMDNNIDKLLEKYGTSELTVDHKNIQEIYNLDLYIDLENLNIVCSGIDKEGVNINKINIPGNLKSLDLIYCSDIENMIFASHIKHLENLSISPDFINDGNGKIEKIEGLDNLTQLRNLDLSHQNIKKIENLDNQKNLEVLELENNNINKMEGLDNLKELKTLNLLDNPIDVLENVEQLDSIEEIYISTENLKYITQESYDYIIKNNVKIYKNNFEYQNFEEVPVEDLDIKIF